MPGIRSNREARKEREVAARDAAALADRRGPPAAKNKGGLQALEGRPFIRSSCRDYGVARAALLAEVGLDLDGADLAVFEARREDLVRVADGRGRVASVVRAVKEHGQEPAVGDDGDVVLGPRGEPGHGREAPRRDVGLPFELDRIPVRLRRGQLADVDGLGRRG